MPKLRAIEVRCTDGTVITVHEPRTEHLGVFLSALPSLRLIAKATTAAQQDGVIGVPIDIPDRAIEGIYPLFAIMCTISVDEFKALPLWDGLGVLNAFGEFVPNPPAATTDSTPSPNTPPD